MINAMYFCRNISGDDAEKKLFLLFPFQFQFNSLFYPDSCSIYVIFVGGI